MGKSFKFDPDLKEETTRVPRAGNLRKKLAVMKIKERRRERMKEKMDVLREDNE